MVFRFPPMVLFLVFMVAVCSAAVAALARCYSWGARVMIPSVLIAFFALGIVLPNMALDRVVVTPKRIEQRTGFWFAPMTKGFDYGDVESVRIAHGVTGGRRRGKLWYVRHLNGKVEPINPGDLWESNTQEIVPLLEGYGVTFE